MQICNLLAKEVLKTYPEGFICDNTLYIEVDGEVFHNHEIGGLYVTRVEVEEIVRIVRDKL